MPECKTRKLSIVFLGLYCPSIEYKVPELDNLQIFETHLIGITSDNKKAG